MRTLPKGSGAKRKTWGSRASLLAGYIHISVGRFSWTGLERNQSTTFLAPSRFLVPFKMPTNSTWKKASSGRRLPVGGSWYLPSE